MAKQGIRFKLKGKDIYRMSDYVFQEVFDYADDADITPQSWMPVNANISSKKLVLNPFRYGASGLVTMDMLNMDWGFHSLISDGTDIFANIITSGTQLFFKYDQNKMDFLPLSIDADPDWNDNYIHKYGDYYYYGGGAENLAKFSANLSQFESDGNPIADHLPSATVSGTPGYFKGKYWYDCDSGKVTRYDLDVYDDAGTELFNQAGVESIQGLFEVNGIIYIHTQDWFGGLAVGGWEHKLVGNAFVLNKAWGAGGAAQVIVSEGQRDWAVLNGYVVDTYGCYHQPGGVPQVAAGWTGTEPMFATSSAIYYTNALTTTLFRWIPPAAPVDLVAGNFDLYTMFNNQPLVCKLYGSLLVGEAMQLYVNPSYSDILGKASLRRLAPSAYSDDFWDNDQWLRCSITPHIGTGNYSLWAIIGDRDITSASTTNIRKHLGVKVVDGTIYMVAGDGTAETTKEVGSLTDATKVNIDVRKEGSTLYCYLDNVQVGSLSSGLPTGDATEDEMYCVNIQIVSAATYFDVHDIRYYQDRSDDLVA